MLHAFILIPVQIGKSFVVSKLKDYPQFRSVAIAINRSGFKVCNIQIFSLKTDFFFLTSTILPYAWIILSIDLNLLFGK